jgi:hypothetical protein
MISVARPRRIESVFHPLLHFFMWDGKNASEIRLTKRDRFGFYVAQIAVEIAAVCHVK